MALIKDHNNSLDNKIKTGIINGLDGHRSRLSKRMTQEMKDEINEAYKTCTETFAEEVNIKIKDLQDAVCEQIDEKLKSESKLAKKYAKLMIKYEKLKMEALEPKPCEGCDKRRKQMAVNAKRWREKHLNKAKKVEKEEEKDEEDAIPLTRRVGIEEDE